MKVMSKIPKPTWWDRFLYRLGIGRVKPFTKYTSVMLKNPVRAPSLDGIFKVQPMTVRPKCGVFGWKYKDSDESTEEPEGGWIDGCF